MSLQSLEGFLVLEGFVQPLTTPAKHSMCVMVAFTPVPTKLTGEVTGDDRLLHQLPEHNKDFGWNQITFDVHIVFVPLLKGF